MSFTPQQISSLIEYCSKHVSGFVVPSGCVLVLDQFSHGQSNPTFAMNIKKQDGSVHRRYVLRKKPAGQLLVGAHQIEREYRVMSALRSSAVPVPLMYSFCSDVSILGTPFYVMEFVNGRVITDIQLKNAAPIDRFAIYQEMNRVLAELHNVNIKDVGLEDYGKVDNYLERQVRTWSRQYDASVVEPIPAMQQLKDALLQNLPKQPQDNLTTIVHGDFRVDNLMFHPRENRVLAVLDWELSTLGNPLTDLAYNCCPYYIPADSKLMPGLKGLKLEQLGIPTQQQYMDAWARKTKKHGRVTSWPFYVSLSFFRSASIAVGVYARSLKGNASQSEQSKQFGRTAPLLAQLALDIINNTLPLEDNKQVYAAQLAQFDRGLMPFQFSSKFYEIRNKLVQFLYEEIYPNEATFHAQHEHLTKVNGHPWVIPPIIEDLKQKARAAGLWNLFLAKNPVHKHNLGSGLTNLEYAPLAELTGRVVHMAPEIFNCAAPDTGNMEVLANYGSAEQKEQWLKPLMDGTIRSAFAMTEPAVASSDATNIECSIQRDGDEYIINGRKWWTSGAMDPRCRVLIVMGKTDPHAPRHKQQSMIIVPIPYAGVKIIRPLHVFGYNDAPHGHAEISFTNVRVPASNMLLGEGRGFEIAQGRLGPGRIHHCMRLIGMAERALELMVSRTLERHAFHSPLARKGAILADIAQSRIEIDSCRLLTLQAASMMDTVGNKAAAQQIGMIKVAAPHMCLRVLDRAIQAHGAKGVSQDTPLAWLWASARTLRLADGPDEVHRENIANIELRKAKL